MRPSAAAFLLASGLSVVCALGCLDFTCHSCAVEGDAAIADGGGADASLIDAGLTDAGLIDSGAADAGCASGCADAGPDAGCGEFGKACCRGGTCDGGFLCASGICCAPSCAALKAMDAGDGVYPIANGGTLLHAYCDTQQGLDLCDDNVGSHRGVTRDSSHLAYTMTSVLQPLVGQCKAWNIASGAFPLSVLYRVTTPYPMPSCQALGFVSDYAFNGCSQYGTMLPNTCGFQDAGYYWYGNDCASSTCTTGQTSGSITYYELQGPIYNASLLSSVDGTHYAVCLTQ